MYQVLLWAQGDCLKIFYDARWIGDHGIGRVARMLDQSLRLPHLQVGGSPSSPLDALRMFFAITFRTPAKSCVFSPGYNAPLFTFKPYVFMIYDLNHIDRAENSSRLKRLYYELIMRRACRNAAAVMTVSEYSKARIVEWAGVPESKITNVGIGVDGAYAPTVTPHAPGYPYLLCVSNRRSHKNEPRVLEAFAKAQIDPEIRLILTGTATEALLAQAEQLGIAQRVIFAGRVPEADLPGYYRGAVALVFPSLYEGFGLPAIEAMACGVPVLTSNTTSLPEAAGNAALLVDPESVEQISAGIERLCGDQPLRAQMIERGFVQAAHFTWEMTTTRVSNVLREIDRKVLK